MINFLKKFLLKLTNKQKYINFKTKEDIQKNLSIYNSKFKLKIENIHQKINSSGELNLSHCGHVGDIIYPKSIYVIYL